MLTRERVSPDSDRGLSAQAAHLAGAVLSKDVLLRSANVVLMVFGGCGSKRKPSLNVDDCAKLQMFS